MIMHGYPRYAYMRVYVFVDDSNGEQDTTNRHWRTSRPRLPNALCGLGIFTTDTVQRGVGRHRRSWFASFPLFSSQGPPHCTPHGTTI